MARWRALGYDDWRAHLAAGFPAKKLSRKVAGFASFVLLAVAPSNQLLTCEGPFQSMSVSSSSMRPCTMRRLMVWISAVFFFARKACVSSERISCARESTRREVA